MKYERTKESYKTLNRNVYFLGCRKDYETYQEMMEFIIIDASSKSSKRDQIADAALITGIDERTLFRLTSPINTKKPSIKSLVKFCVGFDLFLFDAITLFSLASYDMTSVRMRAVFATLQMYCLGANEPGFDEISKEKTHERIEEALKFLELSGTKYR